MKNITMQLFDVLNIVAEVESYYPKDIFAPPPKGRAPDCYTAAGARLACYIIKEKLEAKGEK